MYKSHFSSPPLLPILCINVNSCVIIPILINLYPPLGLKGGLNMPGLYQSLAHYDMASSNHCCGGNVICFNLKDNLLQEV